MRASCKIIGLRSWLRSTVFVLLVLTFVPPALLQLRLFPSLSAFGYQAFTNVRVQSFTLKEKYNPSLGAVSVFPFTQYGPNVQLVGLVQTLAFVKF